ncbi:MAG TPA: metallopeptidase family protein [Kiritimatiellia bacterium]|jgi:predicted Zn-dependent protease with MMP-like domain|nr:metallopeptidase family protein [Kiritimatiellia bacterium]HOM58816.1 metallopeptidase family protein [Kiritimatiellia bacterium]HOR97332.1 metallopeptidase family protein [Kiritimatiellia bacterium]HPC48599.1 metallopeptidase family protein [Kiritimatiellia bacterium]HPK37310.1 metallopeptidase family protein [Kiritimatiellia bacterium]
MDWYALADEEVRTVYRDLPDDLRTCLARLTVTLDSRPAPSERSEPGDRDGLLGLFTGPGFAESEDSDMPMPAAIRLFVENLRDEARNDPLLFRQEVRTTLLHEFGHYLGWDESDLAARGLA